MKTESNEEKNEGEEKKYTLTFGLLVQVFLSITSAILVVIVVPWGTWATQKIMTLEDFKNQGPRITQKDMDNLHMIIKNECTDYYDQKSGQIQSKLDAIAKGVDSLRERLIEHEAKTTREFKELGRNGT